MSEGQLALLLKIVETEPNVKEATDAANDYCAVMVSSGVGTAFDAGVDIGYVNNIRIRNGLEPVILDKEV